MKKTSLALLFLLFSKSAVATDLGIHGVTYQIKEKSLLEEIQEKLQEAKKDGRLDKFQNGVKKQMLDQANNPEPVDGILKATSSREWLYDPSISWPDDLKDQNGKVFYRAGTKVNPLDKISLTRALLFIDGSDESQVKWALDQYNRRKSKAKIILVKGRIIDLMKKKKVRLYFDQTGFLVKKFSIKAVPASVEQEGKMLRVKEVAL
jgi:conjugal transfer pilus assembly protein TraW